MQFDKDAAPPSSATGEKPTSRKTRISLGGADIQSTANQTDFSPPVARGGIISRMASAASSVASSFSCFPRRSAQNYRLGNIDENLTNIDNIREDVPAASANLTHQNISEIRLEDGTVISYHDRMTDEEKFSNPDFIRDANKYFKSKGGYHSEMHKYRTLFNIQKFSEDALEHVTNRCKKEATELVSNAGDLVTYGKNLEEAANFSVEQFSDMLDTENSVIARIVGAVRFFFFLQTNLSPLNNKMIEDPRAKHNKSRNPRKDRSLLRLMILGFILKARSENAGPLQRIISYCLVSQSVKKEVITSHI